MSAELAYPAEPPSVSSVARERLRPLTSVVRRSAAAVTSREIYSAAVANSRATAAPSRPSSWVSTLQRRVDELSRLVRNWDSYGGAALDERALATMVQVLVQLDSSIQSPPIVSMTGEGGLRCVWHGFDSELELTAFPDQPPTVYFCETAGAHEWEGLAVECPQLDKWMWQASFTH